MAVESIRLTDAVNDRTGFALFKSTAPISSSQGISVAFNFYAYGGTGGDGIAFFLVDGNQATITSGGFGGSLGYAPRTDFGISGLPGGYLGVAFDSFGNFSNPTEGRIGGPGLRQNSVAVRGSQAQNYAYLTGTETLPLSFHSPSANREAARRRAQLDLTADGILTIKLDLNNDGDFNDASEIPINSFNVAAANGSVPGQIRFGFSGSTGASTDIHEVDGFQVTTLAGVPIGGVFSADLTFTGGDRNDTLIGGGGNDIISGGGSSDVVTGGTGGDRFVFSGASKTDALRSSTLRNRDRITDFNQAEGDRFVLDFDSNLATVTLPKGVFNAGRLRGNLQQAIQSAYADKNQQRRGRQALKADEAVFFRVGSRSYLSVNDGRASFSVPNDLVADVTGIRFKPGDAGQGKLLVQDYFA